MANKGANHNHSDLEGSEWPHVIPILFWFFVRTITYLRLFPY